MMVAGASTVAIRTAASLDGVVAGKDESVDWHETTEEFEDGGDYPRAGRPVSSDDRLCKVVLRDERSVICNLRVRCDLRVKRGIITALLLALAACAPPSPKGEAEAAGEVAEVRQLPLASPQNRVVGLLTLPQIFGDHTCDPVDPSDVIIYSMPDTAFSIGTIRVTQPWTMHEIGGCEGLRVEVLLESSSSATELPTLEYGYETPGAVVLDRRDDWFKIRIAGGDAWIRGSQENRFISLEELLLNNLTYIAEPDGMGLSSLPESADRIMGIDLLSTGRSVKVLEVRVLNGSLWLRIQVHSHSPCELLEEPVIVSEGWLPAHTQSGEPIVWFHSRGC